MASCVDSAHRTVSQKLENGLVSQVANAEYNKKAIEGLRQAISGGIQVFQVDDFAHSL